MKLKKYSNKISKYSISYLLIWQLPTTSLQQMNFSQKKKQVTKLNLLTPTSVMIK